MANIGNQILTAKTAIVDAICDKDGCLKAKYPGEQCPCKQMLRIADDIINLPMIAVLDNYQMDLTVDLLGHPVDLQDLGWRKVLNLLQIPSDHNGNSPSASGAGVHNQALNSDKVGQCFQYPAWCSDHECGGFDKSKSCYHLAG